MFGLRLGTVTVAVAVRVHVVGVGVGSTVTHRRVRPFLYH